jgi:hypothetical protein
MAVLLLKVLRAYRVSLLDLRTARDDDAGR